MIPCGKRIYLCDPMLHPISVLNGLVTDSVQFKEHIKDYTSLSFDVDRFITVDGTHIQSNGYDDLNVYMYLYLEDIGFFQMQTPSVQNDGWKEYKSITSYSIEKEFEDKDVVGFDINTGEDGSYERLDDNNLDAAGIPKNYVYFYRDSNKYIDGNFSYQDYSLMHIILDKMPGWTIGEIDKSLWFKIISISVDSTNIYALLNSQIAPKAECIFTFDIKNKKLNAISKDRLEVKTIDIVDRTGSPILDENGNQVTVAYNDDYDTNVFIGFRNLANSIEISSEEDSVFTQFTCQGEDDLELRDVNYGDNTILDLSYFLCEPYMTDDLSSRLKEWIKWKDDNRDAYINLSKQWANLTDQITELYSKVPNDAMAYDQYYKMSIEELLASDGYWETLLYSIQLQTDGRDDSDRYRKDINGDYLLDSNGNKQYLPQYFVSESVHVISFDEIKSKIIAVNDDTKSYHNILKYIFECDTVVDLDTDERTYNYFHNYCEIAKAIENIIEDKSKLDNENDIDVLNLKYHLKTIDHNKYLQILNSNDTMAGYNTYNEIMQYILPNVCCALALYYDIHENNYDPKKDFVTEYETDWKLYGITELENKIQSYKNVLDALEEKITKFDDGTLKAWSDLSEDEKKLYANEDTYNIQYNKFELYKSYMDGAQLQLDILQAQAEQLDSQLETVSDKRQFMSNFSKINPDCDTLPLSYTNDNGDTITHVEFTEEEIILISTLTHNTDYKNSNFFTVSTDTLADKVSEEKRFYDDAIEKLSEVSQPQYTFSANLDNLLRLNEFKCFADNCNLLNYIRLGIRDDYSVKVRIIGREWNPCEITPNLTLEFSNMITSRSGRSDLTNILENENNRGNKNSITLGASTNYDTQFATTLLQTMVNSGAFQKQLDSALNGASATIGSIISEYVEAGEINVGYITGSAAEFEKFYSSYGKIDTLVSQSLQTQNIGVDQITDSDGNTFVDLVNGSLNINKIVSDSIFTDQVTALSTTAAKSAIDTAYITDVIANNVAVSDLKAGDIVVSDSMRILSQEDGKSGLVVNGSTMQFIDGNGDVGIQIGYDTSDKPSIIIKDDNGTALFTSSGENAGISAAAIADGLIVNDMVKDGSIDKSKFNFSIETDEDGNVITSIENIYTGDGNKFGIEYTTYKENVDSIQNDIYEIIDKDDLSIKSGVWEKTYLYKPVYNDDGTVKVDENGKIVTEKDAYNIIQRTVETIKDLNGIQSTVSEITENTKNISKIEQKTDYIIAEVIGDDGQSSFSISPTAIESITDQFVVKSPDGSTTIISGGNIVANSINSSMISTDAIKSTNYDGPEDYSSEDNPFSNNGTFIDLADGSIHTKNFGLTSDGDAYFNGDIVSKSGNIGGWTIEQNRLYSEFNDGTDTIEARNNIEMSLGSAGFGTVTYSTGVNELIELDIIKSVSFGGVLSNNNGNIIISGPGTGSFKIEFMPGKYEVAANFNGKFENDKMKYGGKSSGWYTYDEYMDLGDGLSLRIETEVGRNYLDCLDAEPLDDDQFDKYKVVLDYSVKNEIPDDAVEFQDDSYGYIEIFHDFTEDEISYDEENNSSFKGITINGYIKTDDQMYEFDYITYDALIIDSLISIKNTDSNNKIKNYFYITKSGEVMLNSGRIADCPIVDGVLKISNKNLQDIATVSETNSYLGIV